MTTPFETVWHRTCDNLEIDQSIVNEWLAKIRCKYESELQRVYHNYDLLQFKANFILSNETGRALNVSNAVILAMAFQYFNFDVKSDCNEQNLNVFKEFAKAALLDDKVCIQLPYHHIENYYYAN